jgi:hypothetical protein
MSTTHDVSLSARTPSLDRRTAIGVYVPPTLAALGLVTRTSHGISGAGSPPHSAPSGGAGGHPGGDGGDGQRGGGTTAPRDHTGVARQDGRGSKPR